MMRLRTLLYEVKGRIAQITLNRPHRGNGIVFAMVNIGNNSVSTPSQPGTHHSALAHMALPTPSRASWLPASSTQIWTPTCTSSHSRYAPIPAAWMTANIPNLTSELNCTPPPCSGRWQGLLRRL